MIDENYCSRESYVRSVLSRVSDLTKTMMEFACPDGFHKHFKSGLHVLVCPYHKDKKENQNLVEKFKMKIAKNHNLESFSKEISISCFSKSAILLAAHSRKEKSAVDVVDNAINVEGSHFNHFFDSGCVMIIKKSAVDCLMRLGRAKLAAPGPITPSEVGDTKSICEHGAYSVRLPLKGAGTLF